MPMHFDIGSIPEHVRIITVDGEDRLNPRTESLIMATTIIGIPCITKDNAAEFFARTSIWEALYGALMGNVDGPKPVESADIHAHIGLKTNAGTLSEATWRKRIFEDQMRIRRDRYKQTLVVELSPETEALLDSFEAEYKENAR